MFGLVQLLDFHGVPFLVVSAALFDLLHLRIHPGHVHGIALGLCAGIKHDQLDVVFCVGDPAAIGALSSITAAGADTKIIGYDGNPEGIAEIKKGGSWVADVAQDPVAIGKTTLSTVKSYLEGATPEAEILISPYMIDAENAQ